MINRGVQREIQGVKSVQQSGFKIIALIGTIVTHANVRVPTLILDVR